MLLGKGAKVFPTILFLWLIVIISGCGPVGIIKTTARIPTIFGEEENVKDIFTDEMINAGINIALLKAGPEIASNTERLVREGRVLLIGRFASEEQRKAAIDAIWSVKGVKEVIDETKVISTDTVLGYVSDTWLTAKINAKLIADNEIPSVNYNIKTDQGVVFVMGIARTRDELRRVVDIIRKTNGVQKVVSYTRIKEIDKTPSKFAVRDNKRVIVEKDMKGRKIVELDKKYLRDSTEPDDITVKKYR